MLTLLPQGLERPLVFDPEASHVADMLASVLLGWPMLTEVSSARPLLRVFAEGEGEDILIKRRDNEGESSEPSAVSAVCSLVVEVVDALAAASPDLVCLHAAAAEFCGRLVLFPAAHRAGKSTLMARLAAEGRRVFADDILPFDLATGEAVATGCLPRLRLPLPRGSSTAFRGHVRERTVMCDGYYAYVEPRDGALVRFGERLPLGAVVLLDRGHAPVKARLEDAPLDQALLEILTRNTRGDRDAPLLLSTFAFVIGNVPIKRLVYSDLEDAIGCLDKEFSSTSPSRSRRTRQSLNKLDAPKPPSQAAATTDVRSVPTTHGTFYRRNAFVQLDRVGASGFLANPGDNSIHVLDMVGLGVWKLLATPQDTASLTTIVSGAFPGMPRRAVADDVGMLLTNLHEKGLIKRLSARNGKIDSD